MPSMLPKSRFESGALVTQKAMGRFWEARDLERRAVSMGAPPRLGDSAFDPFYFW